MDLQTVPNGSLNGEIRVPGDKSISHRALILSAIANGRSQLTGLLLGTDNYATLRALQYLGVRITHSEGDESTVAVEGVGLQGLTVAADPLDFANSGTALRLMAGLLSAQPFNSILTGDASLNKRPMARIVNPLRQMGAKIAMAEHGTPPLAITGGQSLRGIHYELPIASAQVKSCLLLAGLYAQGVTTIVEPVPTRDHLERLLQAFQYPLRMEDDKISLIGGGELQAQSIEIPADISSAAFFIVAATITPDSTLVLRQVGVNPTRLGVINLLNAMGADIEIDNHRLVGREAVADIQVKYAKLHGIDIPLHDVPSAIDEFPAIFIAAACASGTTTLRGARELRVKEADRITAMATGLQTLGIKVKTLPDGILITGGKLQAGEVDSYGDHRVAMAFAVAGCVATGSIVVKNCDHVVTSFPNFVALANSLGSEMCELRVESAT